MAIIKTFNLNSGITLDQAYIRVQGVNGNKALASISIEVFVSQEMCNEAKMPIHYDSHVFVPAADDDAPRWDKQAYEYLKTLPEFEGAIDA